MVSSRPYIILSAAISLDGKIATRTGNSNLSSKNDKNRIHKLRSKVDGILVGRNTVSIDNPVLSLHKIKGKNPTRIVLDSRGNLASNSKILKTCSKIPTIIAVSKKCTKKNLIRLRKFPIDVVICGEDSINIRSLMRILKKKKIKKILLEGGGITNWSFIKQNLIDEAIITVTPFLVGGKDSRSLVEGYGFSKIENAMKLKLRKVSRMKDEIVLFYKI